MTAVHPSSASCKNCSFAPFCLPHQIIIKRNHKIHRRDKVCSTQQPFKSLYVVKSGALKASALELEGRERIINFYLPGEVVGLEAISAQVHPFSVEAMAESVVCEVSFDHLLHETGAKPLLQRYLLQIASQGLNSRHYMGFMHAEQRVAGFLLELSKRLHCQEGMEEFMLPMSRQAMGDYLRLAPETIIRIIKYFQQQGILSTHKKRLRLHNVDKLQWLNQGGLLKNFPIRLSPELV